MGFVAPIMLIGTVFLAMPIIIHLVGRRRAKVVRFAAMDFLLDKKRRTSRYVRLQQLLLLLVRTLICLALPLAVAKPFTSCEERGPTVVRGAQAAVLVIDNSFSSAHRGDGTSLLQRAKNRALSILDKLGPEAEVAVVTTSEGSVSPTDLSRDHLGMRDVIDDVAASSRVADTWTALRRAAQLVEASSQGRRTIYLISSLAASGFRGATNRVTGIRDAELAIIDLTEGARPANLAVTDIRVERDVRSGSRGIEVMAQVANFSGEPVSGHGIDLIIDGAVVARGTIDLPADTEVRKHFVAVVPGTARFADIAVQLASDAIALDNRRYARSELREEARALLVNGDPRTVRYDDELFYLSAALRPGDRGDSGTVLSTALIDELEELPLTEYDVIVLANVPAMDKELVARLSTWVRRGGGLLLAPGDNVDADDYNRTMVPLMPQTVRDAIAVSYGSRGPERVQRALRLAKWESEHPIFSVFARGAPGLSEARFETILLLGPTTRVDERRVLARYTNGATALVEARSGDGRVMLFTSTLDRDWNDLAIQPGYLPLWQQIIRYLARKQEQRVRDDILVGKSALLSVGDNDSRLQIVGPGERSSVIEGEDLQDRKYVRFGETGAPGLYQVTAIDKQAVEHRRGEADFAVNVDTRGSNLAPIDVGLLRSDGAAAAGEGPAVHERRVELWHALAVGLLLLLLVESALLLR